MDNKDGSGEVEKYVVAVAKHDPADGQTSLYIFQGDFEKIKAEVEEGMVQHDGQVIKLGDYVNAWAQELTSVMDEEFFYTVEWEKAKP